MGQSICYQNFTSVERFLMLPDPFHQPQIQLFILFNLKPTIRVCVLYLKGPYCHGGISHHICLTRSRWLSDFQSVAFYTLLNNKKIFLSKKIWLLSPLSVNHLKNYQVSLGMSIAQIFSLKWSIMRPTAQLDTFFLPCVSREKNNQVYNK